MVYVLLIQSLYAKGTIIIQNGDLAKGVQIK